MSRPDPSTREPRPSRAGGYVAALVLTAAVSAWMFSRPKPFALGGDAEMLLHPLLVDVWRHVRSGQLPLWTTGRWGGSPLIADAVVGALYVPYHVAYALTPFPHWRGLDVSVCLHLAWLSTGLVWFLRGLGVGAGPAVAASALLVLNPTWVFVARNWHEYWAALSWWPWLFGACAQLAGAARVRMGLLAAVALAAPVFAGYPEFALYAGVPALAWIPAAPGVDRGKRLVRAIAVGLTGVALAMPQVIPGLQMAEGSIRMGPGSAEKMALLEQYLAMPVRSWAMVVEPAYTGTMLPLSLKIAPAVALLALLGGLQRGFGPRWLLGAALMAGFLATGPNPVYAALHHIPPMSFFGAPMKLFYLVDFLSIVLAAVGLARLEALGSWGRRIAMLVLAAVLFASFGTWSTTAGVVALGAGALVFLPARLLPAAAIVPTVVGSAMFLVAAQALTAPYSFLIGAYMNLLRDPPPPIAAAGDRVIALRQDEQHLVQAGLNYGALWGVESWNGMGDLLQWRQAGVLEPATTGAAPAIARQLGAGRVVVDARGPLVADLQKAGFSRTYDARGLAWFTTPGPPAPRVQLAASAEALPAAEALERARAGRAFDDRHVVIEADALPGGAAGDPQGRVELQSQGAARLVARVAVDRPTWLVAREPYYANWRATIDGQRAAVFPAGGCLLGVLVPEGTHDVLIEYTEPGLLWGAILAIVALGMFPRLFRRC